MLWDSPLLSLLTATLSESLYSIFSIILAPIVTVGLPYFPTTVLLDFPLLAVITPVVGYVPVLTILSINETPSVYS